MLLEGGAADSAELPSELSQRAKQQLRRLGVEVRESMLVTDVRPGFVSAGGWTIPTGTVVWAAGNVASPLLKSLDVPLDRQGRVLVEPDCTAPGHPEIFVLGDAAAYVDQEIKLCPLSLRLPFRWASTQPGPSGRHRRSAQSALFLLGQGPARRHRPGTRRSRPGAFQVRRVLRVARLDFRPHLLSDRLP